MFWSNDSNRCMHARYMCRTYMWMSKSWTGKLHYLIMYVSVARTARKARHTHVTRTHSRRVRSGRFCTVHIPKWGVRPKWGARCAKMGPTGINTLERCIPYAVLYPVRC